MTDYNVMLDLGTREPGAVDLDPFAPYSGVLGGTPLGTVELILTVPAARIDQAVVTATGALWRELGIEPRAVRALSTEDFDTGFDVLDATTTITVAQAAELLGVTPSAVRQRLNAGTLSGTRTGRDWTVSARLAALYAGEDGDAPLVARLHAPAGQLIVYEGTRYRPTGNGHSVGGQPTAYTYVPATSRHELDQDDTTAVVKAKAARRRTLPR